MGTQRVQLRVVRRFKEGWLCAEAVALAVCDQLKVETEPQFIRAVSAFNFGMGGTGTEHCGAFTGGIATLGVLFGRHTQRTELTQLHSEVTAFKKWFAENHGSLNCRVLIDLFDGSRETECVGLAANAAQYLISRQDTLLSPNVDSTVKRNCVLPGQCPFTCGDQ